MGERGETHWWGIWRRARASWAAGGGCPQPTAYNEYPGHASEPFAVRHVPVYTRSPGQSRRPSAVRIVEQDQCQGQGHDYNHNHQQRHDSQEGEVAYDSETDIVVAPLEIGHLRILEQDAEKASGGGNGDAGRRRRSSILEHRRFSLIDPIGKGKRRQSGVAPMVPMQLPGAKRYKGDGNVEGVKWQR